MIRTFGSIKMNKELMTKVLEDTKKLIALPDNDFAWSSWEDKEKAVNEIDMWINKIASSQIENTLDLEVIFAPTGPLYELSLRSGWGDLFIEVSNRFDKALK